MVYKRAYEFQETRGRCTLRDREDLLLPGIRKGIDSPNLSESIEERELVTSEGRRLVDWLFLLSSRRWNCDFSGGKEEVRGTSGNAAGAGVGPNSMSGERVKIAGRKKSTPRL